MARSTKSSILSKSKRLANTGLKDLNILFRKSSNAILGLASKGFKTLKSKSKRGRGTRRRRR